jgi:hypothetical protein
VKIDDERKAALIEKYRDINVDKWWEKDACESFQERMMQEAGIRVDTVYFNGFCSQGDGACFEGAVEDWGKFLSKTLPACPDVVVKHASKFFSFSCKRTGRYYHSNSTTFDAELPLPFGEEVEWMIETYSPHNDELRSLAWYNILSGYSADDLEEDFKSFFRECMDDLYGELEQEYDYLTSDEVVWESVIANELHEENAA